MNPTPSHLAALRWLALASAVTALPAQPTAPSNATAAPGDPPKEIVVQLSPFEVNEINRGYFGVNTTSGTRINSRIEDLAASITVVTKQQMEDFALLNLNDIFSYEASTEGTGNFTDFSLDQNGAATDAVSLNPQSANRIRGLGPANTTVGNFETSGRVPIDPIDVDAVEISRGPNSSLFGIGNTSGTVNAVPSSASLTANRTQVTTRVDSNEGHRTSVDFNRVVRKGQLALRGSAVYQHDGFHLKPSGTDTVRLNGMVKFRPFKATTLSASLSDYRVHGSRTNFLTPTDGVTDWITNGRPAYDPITGVTTVNGAAVPTNAAVLQGASGNILAFVDRGRLGYLALVRSANVANPTQAVGNATFRQSNLLVVYPNQPLFLTALPVTSKSIYDWSRTNLASANYHRNEAQTTNVSLEQIFLSSGRQKLAAQLGWFREQTESESRIAVGVPRNAGRSSPLYIDVNTRLLDGTPNPYFGRPYIATIPYLESAPIDRDNYRGQVAYQLDLRDERGWLRWLGRHDFSGYAEYKSIVQRRVRWRHTIVSNHPWFPAGVARGSTTNGFAGRLGVNGVIAAPEDHLYLGDAVGGNVDYGPSYFPTGNYTFQWGNNNGANWVREPVTIGSAVADGTGMGGNIATLLKSHGVVWQGHLLGNRIVPTLGWRQDESYTKVGGAFTSPDGIQLDYDSFNRWAPGDWTKGAGPTKTVGVVVKPLRWINFFWNKSNSFRPSSPKQDLYLNRLPDPEGVGKDFGVGLNLFQDKLVLRFNRYITRQLKTPNGPSATFVSRIRRMDFTEFNAESTPGNDPFTLQTVATGWVRDEAAAQGRTLTVEQFNARLADIMKVPVEFLDPPKFANGAADDTLARGFELEANYNPTSTWTMKLNVTKQETLNERIAPEVQQWVAERLPVWQSIIDPTTGRPWFTSVYGSGTNTALNNAAGFLQANVTSQIAQLRATEGLLRPQIRKYRVNVSTNFRLSDITDNKYLKRFNIGGALRWEDKAAIGYFGKQQPPAIVTDYDVTRPVYDEARTYVDLLVGYRTRLFADKVTARFQLNVRNVQENGRLQAIAAFPDGRPYGYRIIEPRLFILSATFDL